MRIRSLILPTTAAILVLGIALALGGGPTVGTSKMHSSMVVSGKSVKVKVYMFAFMPANLTVKAGTRITFTNHDQYAHTATAIDGAFDTGTIRPGKSRTIVVRRPGTYPYHCIFHEFMTGTIKVVS